MNIPEHSSVISSESKQKANITNWSFFHVDGKKMSNWDCWEIINYLKSSFLTQPSVCSSQSKILYKMESYFSLLVLCILKGTWLREDSAYIGSLTGEKKCNCVCIKKVCMTKTIFPHILNSTSKLRYLKSSYTILVPRLSYIFVYYNQIRK